MLFTTRTKQHVINAIHSGAKLIINYYTSGACDDCPVIGSVELDHNGTRLTLSHWEPRPGVPHWFEGETQRMANYAIFDELMGRTDLRRAYSYISDWSKSWREIYESNYQAVPRPIRGFIEVNNMSNKQMARILKREGSLKEQVDQIRFERDLARRDYNHYGGCGHANTKDENILLSYIDKLENEAICLRRASHEWYLDSNNGGMYCRQCGVVQPIERK